MAVLAPWFDPMELPRRIAGRCIQQRCLSLPCLNIGRSRQSINPAAAPFSLDEQLVIKNTYILVNGTHHGPKITTCILATRQTLITRCWDILQTQVEMLFCVLAKAYLPFRWAYMVSACWGCCLIPKKGITKNAKILKWRNWSLIPKKGIKRRLRLERNPRWCEKPSQFLLARTRVNSPEAIVLTELGNLRDPIS